MRVAVLVLLLVGCSTPMPHAPQVMSETGAQCVDHCQERYESCVSHTAGSWGVGAFAFAAARTNREARNACRDNLSACYLLCR